MIQRSTASVVDKPPYLHRLATAAILLLAGGSGLAQEFGRVLSSTPVVQAVNVPRQVCSTESVQSGGSPSGGGAVLGAVAGGAVGNAIGQGSGRAAATVLGIMGGALLGNQIEGGAPAQAQNVQRCTTQSFIETRTTGFQVVYEYAGKQYAVQMPQDPGPFVRLNITAVDAVAPAIAAPPPVTYLQPPPAVIYSSTVFVPTAPVWVPAYPVYGHRPPVGVNLQFGYAPQRHPHWR